MRIDSILLWRTKGLSRSLIFSLYATFGLIPIQIEKEKDDSPVRFRFISEHHFHAFAIGTIRCTQKMKRIEQHSRERGKGFLEKRKKDVDNKAGEERYLVILACW